MSRHRIFLVAVFIIAVVAVLAPAQSLRAQGIVSVSVVAVPQSYVGPAPAKLKFIATVTVESSQMVFNYQWERSDGSMGKKHVVRVTKSTGKTLTLEVPWQLGAPGKQYHVWEKIHVACGNQKLTSVPAEVTVTCK
jgi:hypothetical protein